MFFYNTVLHCFSKKFNYYTVYRYELLFLKLLLLGVRMLMDQQICLSKIISFLTDLTLR